jgi:hypothetical protein
LSRAVIQSTSAAAPPSTTAAALATVSGLGTPCPAFGSATWSNALFLTMSAASSQPKNPRSAAMVLANERPVIPA